MSMKQLILTSAAALAITLSATSAAQTAAAPQTPAGAEQYKHEKVDAATAADARYHANRTEPNRQARDQAQAEASAAIERANGPAPYQGQR